MQQPSHQCVVNKSSNTRFAGQHASVPRAHLLAQEADITLNVAVVSQKELCICFCQRQHAAFSGAARAMHVAVAQACSKHTAPALVAAHVAAGHLNGDIGDG